MDGEPIWLTLQDARVIHKKQINAFGGAEGEKSVDLIESALAAPQNLYHYEYVDDPLVLGIRLARSIAKNHGFIDGNKRTAAAGMVEFLSINGWDLDVPDDDENNPLLGQLIEGLVVGELTEDDLYDRLIDYLNEIDVDEDGDEGSDIHTVFIDTSGFPSGDQG